ncbi:hypothetical protein PC128_g10676 [Phytophthora cactorum]|nr:hypothetical protein PC128_g10676 [Phytophthora cactorum]
MRTSFADAEDKLLVQIAFQFEREGLRITWDYVVRRMKTKRPARQFRGQQGQTVCTLRRRRTFRASACDREVSATAETIQLSPQPHQEQSLATGMLMTTPLRASVAQSASRSPQNFKDNKVTVAREQYALRQQQGGLWWCNF